MAATEEDIKTQELNSIFKFLGQRGPKAQFFLKRGMDHVRVMPEILSDFTFEMYGSTAEDLKAYEPKESGDWDILISPKSEDLMIRENQIEYLPAHPVHVRIKGIDHPVFQSCLVEDTEYVSTSALKNFLPAIYGHLGDLFLYPVQLLTREELQSNLPFFWNLKSNKSGPAETLEVFTSKSDIQCHVLEQFKRLNEMQNEGIWNVTDAFGFPNLETASKTELHNMNNIESGIKGEERKDNFLQMQAAAVPDQQCVTPERGHEVESDSGRKNSFHGTFPSSSSENGDITSATSSESSVITSLIRSLQFPMSRPKKIESLSDKHNQVPDQAGEDVDKHNENNTNGDRNENQNESKAEQQILFLKGLEPVRDVPCRQFLEHLFRSVPSETKEEPLKEPNSQETEKLQLHHESHGIDYVPALRSRGWPKVAREWIKRERKWPSPDVVDRIIQGGFHLVVKPPKNGGNPDCDFRISFSHAEYLLSQEMNDIQRECYRCLKRYFRAYLSTQPKGLVTFHLKSILLQTIEETGAEMWTENKRSECVLKLLGNLYEALTKKDLPHFFVRSYNLFDADYMESSKILDSLAVKVKQIMENPMQFAKDLIQNQHEECIPGSELIPSATPLRAQRQAESKETPSTHQESGPATLYRYCDVENILKEFCKELIDMAFKDGDYKLEALDPLERSVVEYIRETGKEPFIASLKRAWDSVCLRVWILSTESNIRRNMLEAIHGVIETWKYIKKKVHLGTGSVESIARRMLHPSAEDQYEDPFDLNNIIPAGAMAQGLQRILNTLMPFVMQEALHEVVSRMFDPLAARPAQPQQVDMDDIPLD